MRIDRRAMTAGLAAAFAARPGAAGATPNWLAPRAQLVDAYSPEREAELYPEGPPLMALFAKDGFEVAWIGVAHIAEPLNETAAFVRAAIRRQRPGLVVLEGVATALGPNPAGVLGKTRALAPDQGSETDVAIRAALEVRAMVRGGEPTDAELITGLVEEGFGAVDVSHALLFGPLEQAQREGAIAATTDEGFPAAFAAIAESYQAALGLEAPVALEDFRSWFEARFEVALDEDSEWWTRGWPGREGIAADIARASNLVRGRQAYTTVMTNVALFRSVAAVYGASHLSSVWTALEATFGPPTVLRAADLLVSREPEPPASN